MTGIRCLIVLAAGLCLIAAPAVAQTFTGADRSRVEARVSQLEAVVSSGDLAGAMEVVPPRLFATIAERAGASEADLLEAMREMIRTQLAGVSIVEYRMDLAAASPVLTPDGSQTYLMIPTELLMQVPNVGRVRARTNTLALKDAGDWYLIRVEDPTQVNLVRDLWPAFVAVDFPSGTTELVD